MINREFLRLEVGKCCQLVHQTQRVGYYVGSLVSFQPYRIKSMTMDKITLQTIDSEITIPKYLVEPCANSYAVGDTVCYRLSRSKLYSRPIKVLRHTSDGYKLDNAEKLTVLSKYLKLHN